MNFHALAEACRVWAIRMSHLEELRRLAYERAQKQQPGMVLH